MTGEEKTKYLANICCLLIADGDIDLTEQEVFNEISQGIGAGLVERQDAVRMARGLGYQVRLVGRWSQRIRNLEDMLLAAYCNGVFEKTEKKAIQQYARQLGINQEQFDMIKQEAKRRYAEFKRKQT
jgi:tellurite resistance protein